MTRSFLLVHSVFATWLTPRLVPNVGDSMRALSLASCVFSYFSLGWGVAARRGLRDKEIVFHFCHEGNSVMTFYGRAMDPGGGLVQRLSLATLFHDLGC